MENVGSSEGELDLESGDITSEEDTSKDLANSGDSPLKITVSGVLRGFFGSSGSTGRVGGVNSISNVENSSVVDESVELLVDKYLGGEESDGHVALVDKKRVKEKRKKSNFNKAPKPPRPPKGPLIDAADMMLVKEISEIAMKKRSRIEHMKALKKMKATKAASSSSSSSLNSTLAAMIITVLFFLVILFQGICSRSSSSVSFQGSPEPSKATDGLISVQIYKDFSSTDRSGPNSASPNDMEEVSGSESRSQDKLG